MRPHCARGLALIAAGAFALLAGGTRAQDAGQTAGFRATAEIVQFDALFLDGEGRPVADIRKEEVTVRQSGTPVFLRDLRFQPRASAAAVTAQAPSPPTASAVAATLAPPASVEVEPWIFLIDDLAMSPDAFDRVKVGLRMLFEQQLPSGAEVGLLRTGDLGNPTTRLTADRSVLRRTVSEMRYKVNRWRGGAMSRSGAHGASASKGDRVFLEGTLGSLNSLIVNLHALPGRKVVVLLSEYLTLRVNDRDVEPGRSGIGTWFGVLEGARYNDVAARFRRLGQVAAAAGVTVQTRQGFFTR